MIDFSKFMFCLFITTLWVNVIVPDRLSFLTEMDSAIVSQLIFICGMVFTVDAIYKAMFKD